MNLDKVLVPLGVFVIACYHTWLFFTIIRRPQHTVIGINTIARRRWVTIMMSNPVANGVLSVQTVRNNMTASTMLATAALTLASLFGVFVSVGGTEKTPTSLMIYGSNSDAVKLVKFFSIILCLFLAFLCNVQSIRYYVHISYFIVQPMPTTNTSDEAGQAAKRPDPAEYVTWNLNRGSYFWSLGLRAFYLAFILFLWIFGPIPMFVVSVLICFLLYFFDTTNQHTRNFHLSFDDNHKLQII